MRRDPLHLLLPAALLCVPHALHAQWCPFPGPEFAPPGIDWQATIPAGAGTGDPLLLSGVVRSSTGVPAGGVIVFAYHTDRSGAYPRSARPGDVEKFAGRLHGWARTDGQGRYQFRTTRPGAYPRAAEPQHVHLRVMPPDGVPCEIDAVEFTDDPLLTAEQRRAKRGYGGSGIVTPRRDGGGTWLATRDIVLWPGTRTDTLRVDAEATNIRWVGTKFGGRGRHEGTIGAAPGDLVIGGLALLQGRITFPVSTLAITDIPLWEPVPRGFLRRRLLGPTMLDSARFPTATLVVRRATRVAPNRLRVDATLGIRDSTRALTFEATTVEGPEGGTAAEASFRINRHLWGLAYRGSQASNDLIDDDIAFTIRIVARRR